MSGEEYKEKLNDLEKVINGLGWSDRSKNDMKDMINKAKKKGVGGDMSDFGFIQRDGSQWYFIGLLPENIEEFVKELKTGNFEKGNEFDNFKMRRVKGDGVTETYINVKNL